LPKRRFALTAVVVVFDCFETICESTQVTMASTVSVADAYVESQRRATRAGKVSVKRVLLPAVPPAKRFMEEPRDMFEAFKHSEERERLATIKAEQMLDDKYLHGSVRELKFKANLPRLLEALPDDQTLRPSKLHAFSGLQELTEQLKKSQRKVVKADRVGMAQFLEVAKKKPILLGDAQSDSMFKETQSIIKAKKEPPTQKQVELFDRWETNIFRKRFHQVKDRVSNQSTAQKEMEQINLQPEVVLSPLHLSC